MLEKCLLNKELAWHSTLHLERAAQFQHTFPRTRQRAQCMLLSHKGDSIPELAEIFRVHHVTIYNWLNAWEAEQFGGLADLPGQGNTPKIEASHYEHIRTWARQFPRQPRKIQQLIHD